MAILSMLSIEYKKLETLKSWRSYLASLYSDLTLN